MKEKIFKWLLISLTLFNFVFTTPIFATEENGSISNCDENGICTGTWLGEEIEIVPFNPDIGNLGTYYINEYKVTSYYIAGSGSIISFGTTHSVTCDIGTVTGLKALFVLPEALDSTKYYDLVFTIDYYGVEIDTWLMQLTTETNATPSLMNGSIDVDVQSEKIYVTFDNVLYEPGLYKGNIILYTTQIDSLVKFQVTNITVTDVTDDVIADREEQEKTGLLNTIIAWIKDILDAIINLPIHIKNALSGLFQAIVNAVNSIGDLIVNAINKIQQWLKDLLNGILEGLKSLFIPSNEYFKNYFDELYTFFTEKLGILMLPIDIMIQVFNGIMNIENGDGFIHVPEVKYMDCVLIPKTDYDVQSAITEVMGQTYELYYLFVDVILIVMVLNMARVKFDEIVGGKK